VPPSGTTALVRCPACKTVFSPTGTPGPKPEEPEEQEEEREEVEEVAEKPKAVPRPPARGKENEAGEEDEPQKGARPRSKPREDEKKVDETPNRDFDPITEEEDQERKRKKRRRDDELDPEERAALRAAFERATWGARLIWISLGLFLLSMLLLSFFFIQIGLYRMMTPSPVFLVLAGILGACNWVLAAVGVGLCLSGPRAPGHWGYGIAAAVVTGIHLIFMLALVAQNREYSIGKSVDQALGGSVYGRCSMLTTRLDATMFYMTAVAYPSEQGATPKDPMTLSMITGLVEMVRTVLIMLLLSCLAQAALDNELAHKCTRTAGIASGGPALVALLMLVFVATIVETNAGLNLFTLILFAVVNMSVYVILMGVILPSFMAAREVTDACDEPFQSLIPKL